MSLKYKKDEYFEEDVYLTLVPSPRNKNKLRMKKFTNYINCSFDLTGNTHTQISKHFSFYDWHFLDCVSFFWPLYYWRIVLYNRCDKKDTIQFKHSRYETAGPKIKLEISILKMAQYQLVIQPALPNFCLRN